MTAAARERSCSASRAPPELHARCGSGNGAGGDGSGGRFVGSGGGERAVADAAVRKSDAARAALSCVDREDATGGGGGAALRGDSDRGGIGGATAPRRRAHKAAATRESPRESGRNARVAADTSARRSAACAASSAEDCTAILYNSTSIAVTGLYSHSSSFARAPRAHIDAADRILCTRIPARQFSEHELFDEGKGPRRACAHREEGGPCGGQA